MAFVLDGRAAVAGHKVGNHKKLCLGMARSLSRGLGMCGGSHPITPRSWRAEKEMVLFPVSGLCPHGEFAQPKAELRAWDGSGMLLESELLRVLCDKLFWRPGLSAQGHEVMFASLR